MTDKEALQEIDRQEKRFAAAGFGNGLRLAKSAREYCQTIVKCRQKSAEVAAECAAANEKAVAMTAETNRMEAEARMPSVIETYRNTFQSLMQLRGGFAVADPSVRRLRRPVAGRLTRGDRILRH